MRRLTKWTVLAGYLACSAVCARAEVVLLLEEPYGAFGGMTPTGHAAIYLTRVCAETPVLLRRCLPGEQGVVISRYYKVDGVDWIAIPPIPYLYAVEHADEVPDWVDAREVAALRDAYRRAHLESVAPDESGGGTPRGDWTQLVGEAYDRTIYTYGLDTTVEQDDALIRDFNSHPNHTRFSLLFRNCADFSRRVIDFYYPRAVHRNFTADLGIMTPKQAAKCVLKYSRKHPDVPLTAFIIPQVPGTIPRSRAVRGVLESLVRSKRYALPLAPLAVLHPAVGAGMAYAWLRGYGFQPRQIAMARGGKPLKPGSVVTALRQPEDEKLP
ncbi:MAG TPA: hypothetical protein VMB03_22940 [Bryobacteraceae bacterium]|nr:hypothetical protein [Bryobacteraceae bacterium]